MHEEIDGGGTTAEFWKIFHPRTFISNPPFNEIMEILTEKWPKTAFLIKFFRNFRLRRSF